MTMASLKIERSLKVLTCSNTLLSEIIKKKQWLDDLEKLTVALVDIQIVLKKTKATSYAYTDVLELEGSTLKSKHVEYFNPITCKCESISFKEARALGNTFVYTSDKEGNVHQLPENYDLGNMAIGQIFIDGREGFCKKYAIEHSIESIAYRWYSSTENLIRRLKETGSLVDPSPCFRF